MLFATDFRFKTEFKTSAYSFVIVRHKMPATDEKLLCKKQAMHPPVWVDLDHTDIANGYGAGSVKTIDRGTIYYKELPNSNNKKVNNFVFYLDGKKYSGAYFLIAINEYNYLFFRATSNILPTIEERNKEWYTYASRYIEYLNNRITKTLLSTSKNCNRIKYALYNYISKNYPIDYQRSINNNNHLLVVPSLQYILDTIDDVDSIVSKDCNINSNEDLMRLFLTREYIRKCILYDLTNEERDTLIHTTSNINYSDPELLYSYKDNPLEKTIRAISDIYMGHKFYGSVDLENLLAYALKSNITKGVD